MANLIFLIAVPSEAGDLHLRMLSQLARSLMHEAFREKLLSAETEEAVLDLLKGEG